MNETPTPRQRMAGLINHHCRGEVRAIQQQAHARGDSETMMWASYIGRQLDDLRELLLADSTHQWPPNDPSSATAAGGRAS